MFPASSRNTIRLVVHFRNKKFMVLVTNDATFQDVSTEIVRVYQGISSAASADDGPPMITEIQDVYGCVLFSEYPVGTILRDLADVFAFEEGEAPSSPFPPGTLKPSVLPPHGQLHFPVEMHSTPGFLGDGDGSAVRHASSLSVVPPHAAGYYSPLLCQPVVNTFTQYPSPRYPDCTPLGQQGNITSSDTNIARAAEDGAASECSDSSQFVAANRLSERAARADTNTTSADTAGKDESAGISLIPVTEPRKKSKERNKRETTRTRSRSKTPVLSIPKVIVPEVERSLGRQKPAAPAEETELSKTAPVKEDSGRLGQVIGDSESGPHGSTKCKTTHLQKSLSSDDGCLDKGRSCTEGNSTKVAKDLQPASHTAKDKAPPTRQGRKSSVGESKRKRKRREYKSVDMIVDSDFSDDDGRPKKILSSPSSRLLPSPSLLLATRPKHPKRSRKETTKPVKGTPRSQTKMPAVDQFSSDWSSEDENMSVPNVPKSEHKGTKKTIKSTNASKSTAASLKRNESKPISPAHSKVGVTGLPISAHPFGGDGRKRSKGQIVSKHSCMMQNQLQSVHDVYNFDLQDTFCETHNQTATLYMKSSTTASEPPPKDPPQQDETDERDSGQSTSDSEGFQQPNVEEGCVSSKENPTMTSAPGDEQNSPPRVVEAVEDKEMAEAMDDRSSEEILAEDSQDLDVGIIPATQPTARSAHSTTAETTDFVAVPVVIEETQDVEDYPKRNPESPGLGQTEQTSKEARPGSSPERKEKDRSRNILRGDGVAEKSEPRFGGKLSQHGLQADEEVVADAKQTSGKAPDHAQNANGNDSTTSLLKNDKRDVRANNNTIEATAAPAGSRTGTSGAVQQQVINSTSTSQQAKKNADSMRERLDDDLVESSVSVSVPETSQQHLHGSSISGEGMASGEETVQDGEPKLVVNDVEVPCPTREPSEQRKHETPQSSERVKRKKRKKDKHSKEKDKRKEVDGGETTTDSQASGTRSGGNATLLPSNPPQISPLKPTELSTGATSPDHSSTESTPMDDTCVAAQGLQSTAANQPTVSSIHEPSDSVSELKELTPESPQSIAGKPLKLRGVKRHVASESDISPAKLPLKKQKLSGSCQASGSKDTPPSAGAQHGSTATGHKKKYQKTILSPPHRHTSDTEAKLFGLSPRLHHPLKKKQLPCVASVAPSSSQLKRRLKVVAQPTDLSLSSLSQEEAEYGQSVSMNLTELLGDENLWDEK